MRGHRQARRGAPTDIGDLTGRVALVTGANSGIGYETARRAGRPRRARGAGLPRRGEGAPGPRQARERARALAPWSCSRSTWPTSSRSAGRPSTSSAEHARLDLLVNNAGVMGTPYRQTADGFELQMATNHLGHFALTGLLLDRLVTTERSRVVTVSSHMHRIGRLRLDDVGGDAPRNTWVDYGTSSWPTSSSRLELSRRLTAAGVARSAVAAHPGWTRSNLAGSGAALGRQPAPPQAEPDGRLARSGSRPPRAPCRSCAPPPRRPCARGQYVGPAHLGELYGPPRVARRSAPGPRRRGGGRAVGGVRGADRRALLGRRPRLNAAAARTRPVPGRRRPGRRRGSRRAAGRGRGAARGPDGDDHAERAPARRNAAAALWARAPLT